MCKNYAKTEQSMRNIQQKQLYPKSKLAQITERSNYKIFKRRTAKSYTKRFCNNQNQFRKKEY